jgi:hypothetical protein
MTKQALSKDCTECSKLKLDQFKQGEDETLINYKAFDDYIETVFVEKHLEKAPTKRWEEFKAPSILDP